MLSGIRHFLFDLDGTLVNSSPLHEAAFRAVLAPNHAHLLAGFDYRAIGDFPHSRPWPSLALRKTPLRF